jgi:PPOX class probable F420-dependent enzyme
VYLSTVTTLLFHSQVDAPKSHSDLLSRPIFAHLATVRTDGAPLVNPMWFLWDEAHGVIKLTHTKRRSNYHYLQSEPRVALAISDPDDPYRYLQIRGVVEAIEDDPTGAFYQVLQMRYRGKVSEVADRQYRVIVTVRPTGFKVR